VTEVRNKVTAQQSAPPNTAKIPEIPKEPEVKKSVQPLLGGRNIASRFNLENALKEKKEEKHEEIPEANDNLPNNHFTQSDLNQEWNGYLEYLKKKDIVLYSAVNSFTFVKKDENVIEIHYPSESARDKFSQIEGEFFNKFRHKAKHFNLTFDYHLDIALKKEPVTKKKIFEKYLEINPLLKDLDDLVKFDFS